jgi:hypothetical protein
MVEAQKAEEKKNEEAEVVDKDGKPVKWYSQYFN